MILGDGAKDRQLEFVPFRRVRPFQPTEKRLGRTLEIHNLNDVDQSDSSMSNVYTRIWVRGLPFYSYWQNFSEQEFIFHPMVFGKTLGNTEPELTVDEIDSLLKKVGQRLPNQGWAVYYPNHFRLARMRDQTFVYSCISQGDIINGLMRSFNRSSDPRLKKWALRIERGMLMKFEKGGVNLGPALLEIPNFKSCPEIILNGWLHAILALGDMSILLKTTEPQPFITRNIEFLLKNKNAWENDEVGLTNYSDTSLHRVRIQPSNARAAVKARYMSHVKELGNYEALLLDDFADTDNAYNFRRLKMLGAKNQFLASIAVSKLFATSVWSSSPFSMFYRNSTHDPLKSQPIPVGPWKEVKSSAVAHGHEIRMADLGLDVGSTTTFTKSNGRNFYHMYHIVALLYISHDFGFLPLEIRNKLWRLANEWNRKTSNYASQNPGLQFESLVATLEAINRGKPRRGLENIDELLREPQ